MCLAKAPLHMRHHFLLPHVPLHMLSFAMRLAAGRKGSLLVFQVGLVEKA
ncbi:hypothetical protein MtrunA17_Chr6g0474581 [Medicago truncatula]|uniref:Uncharacterized protein n=1 Tax=Medicago truncatula TaxID=3880 RepID=A0A396HKX5_MEDTR|nr:hypothetical protein MtrunA17_Chr6g0474581 [Medicago truncatula]